MPLSVGEELVPTRAAEVNPCSAEAAAAPAPCRHVVSLQEEEDAGRSVACMGYLHFSGSTAGTADACQFCWPWCRHAALPYLGCTLDGSDNSYCNESRKTARSCSP